MYPKHAKEWIRKFKINIVISLMWETNMTKPKQRNFFPLDPEIYNFVSTKIYIYSNFEEKNP